MFRPREPSQTREASVSTAVLSVSRPLTNKLVNIGTDRSTVKAGARFIYIYIYIYTHTHTHTHMYVYISPGLIFYHANINN